MFARLLSDIHLELSRHKGPDLIQNLVTSLLPCEDQILILAGDIGNPTAPLYRQFLTTVSPYFKLVLMVPGNHEYYQKKTVCDETHRSYPLTMDEVNTVMENLNIPNLHFLNRKSLIYNRVRFLGCTLWMIPDSGLCHYINDFNMIPGLTRLECLKLHLRDRTWLQDQLEISDPDQYDTTVVITHHLPSYQLIGSKYEGDPLNCFYATALDDLVTKADVWCCGHTHSAIVKTIGTTRCYINPVGYINEKTGLDPQLVIPI